MSNAAMGASTVGSCDVTTCSFNKSQQCTAGTIQVSFVDGMAHCATFAPNDGAKGVASEGTASTTTPKS